jgi:hypothetical protein
MVGRSDGSRQHGRPRFNEKDNNKMVVVMVMVKW